MNSSESQRDPIDVIAESFINRVRRGEHPSIDEYVTRHPELADEIRDLFPALFAIEDVGLDQERKSVETQDGQHFSPTANQQLGDFRIIREVGRGGMGIVYEAEQVSLGRRVALKVLPRQALLDSKHKQRFLREAKAAARLHHTNIVPVFGVGEQDGLHYYVMQFIHGLGLDEVLVELQRQRELSVDGVERPERVECRELRVECQGAVREVSAITVANSLLSGHFERTLLVDDVCNQPSATSDLPLMHSTLDTHHSTLNSPSTVVGQLSDTFPGPSAQSSRHHSRTVYWQSIAEIGLQAAQALQYAHDQGVIHRDIKPGNLLLDARGSVWVTDFGLAKSADQQDLTHTGDVLGTLRYMAPEQFDGHADARSDLFSLGLTLYELLALKPAFNERDRHKLIKQVTTGTPQRLRTLDPHIPRDLETIVHKAIDRDPAHRYQTAEELAADLQRYLGSEPIRARWVSPVTRFARWCRRNPAGAGIVALMVIGLIGASAAALVFQKQSEENSQLVIKAERNEADAVAARLAAELAKGEAEDAANRERTLRQTAESERDRANSNFTLARSAVNMFLDDITETELLSVPGLQPLREDLLSSALAFYTNFTQERADDPELLIELADARYRLGRIHWELGDQTGATAANTEAIRLFEHLHNQRTDDLDVQGGLARAYFWASRYDDKIRRYDDTIQLCKTILDAEPRPEIRSLLADTYNTLAIDGNNDIATALAYHRKALELREALAREFPEHAPHLAELGSTVNNIGVLLAEQGRNADALQMFERAVGYSARAYELQPHSIRWGEWLCLGVRNCAYKQEALGETDEARNFFARLVALRRDLAWNNPAVTRLQADLYRACLEQSRYEQQLGNEAVANRAIREGRRILEIIPHDTAVQFAELALMYASLSHPVAGAPNETAFHADEQAEFADQAVASLREAIQSGYRDLRALQQDKLLDPLRERDDFRELLATLEKLRQGEGLTVNDQGTKEEQIASRREALRILGELQQQLDVRTTLAAALHSIGVIQTGLKQFDEAETSFQQALQLRQELQKEDPANVAIQLDLVSTRIAREDLHWNMSRYAEAHRVFQDCLELLANVESDPELDKALQTSIAKCEKSICVRYAQIGLWDLAAEHSRRNFALNRVTDRVGDARFSYLLAFDFDPTVTSEFARNYSAQAGDHHRLLLWVDALFRTPGPELTESINQGRQLYETDHIAWNALALSLALYRNNEPQRALEMLESLKPEEQRLFGLHLGALLHRALGHEDEAVRWREKADAGYRQTIDGILASQQPTLVLGSLVGDGTDDAPPWFELVKVQILRDELDRPQRGGPAILDAWQHLIQARAYRLIGEVQRAEAELAAAMGDTPDDPYVLIARARFLEQWQLEADAVENAWQQIVDRAANDPLPWIQRGRWYAERGESEKAEADFTQAAELTPHELNKFLEDGWWVVGPYPENLDEFCPPEIDPNPSKAVTLIDPQRGLSSEPVAWRHMPTGPLGELQMADVLGGSNGSGYALAYVYAPHECTRLLRVGVAQGIRIWCNRQLVFSADEPLSGNQISASRVPVRLQSGRNEILVRIRLNAPVTLRVADTPADRVLTFGEQGLWKEAADAAFAAEPSVFGERIHDEGYFAAIRMALACGNEPILEREGDRLLQMALGDPSLWNQVRAAGTLIFVDNPLAREHAAELEAALTAVLPATSNNHFQYQDCLRSLVRYSAMLGHIDAARHYVTQLGGDGDKVRGHLAPLWAIVMEREGLHGEALAALELGLHAAAEYQDTYWPWLVWFLGGLRDAEREITGGTARTDEIIVSLGRSALADWESRDPDSAAFDHLAETWGRSGTSVAGPAYPYLARARRLAELGRFDEAESDFNKAFELTSDDPDVLIARAIFHADRGAPETAADDLDSALQLTAAMDEGTAWMTRRKVALQAAIRPAVFERVVSGHEHVAEQELWHARMFVLTYDGDLAAAQQAASQLTGYQPQRAAVALLRNDRLEFERIRDSRPADWNPVYTSRLLMLAPADQPTTGELLSTARQVLDANPDDWHARVNWGIALHRDGQQPEAREQLEPLANSHLRGIVWPVLAMIHHQLGDEPQARQWLQRSNDWLSWQHPGTSADAPRIFKPDVNGFEDWLVAAVFNQEARELMERADTAPAGGVATNPEQSETPDP